MSNKLQNKPDPKNNEIVTINIKRKIFKAIQIIEKEFPPFKSSKNSVEEWINWTLEWYIRNMFTNGNDYIDRQ